MRRHQWWEEHPLVHGHDEWVAASIAMIGFIICWAGVGMLFAGVLKILGFTLFVGGLLIGAYAAIRGGHAKS